MASESSSDITKLCKICKSITATSTNIKTLFIDPGYRHHRKCHLLSYAQRGCSLCKILNDGTESISKKAQKSHIYLRAWQDNGEGDQAEQIREQDRNTYIHVYVQGDIKMTLTVSANEGQAAAEYITRRPKSTNMADNTHFKQARNWLQECVETHKKCSTHIPHTLPTRYLDVGSIDGDGITKLCVNVKSREGDYVALSYAWGGSQPVTTTTATLERHMEGISVKSLPLTIRDAVRVSGELGIRYLWVDALCIIQDSDADKAVEISKMGEIYKNATITIAAGNTRKASDGFLGPRRKPMMSCVPFMCPNGQLSSIVISPLPRYEPLKEPLNSRGWTLQERLLSPRILFYGTAEVSWQCQQDFSKTATELHPVLTQGCNRLPSYVFGDPKAEKCFEGDDAFNRSLVWMAVVEEFTLRDLTNPGDKLLAVLGVASELGKVWNDTYLAGMWRSVLIHQLAWMRHRLPNRRYDAPRTYRAPSWSWAAIDGPVRMMMLEDVYAELVDCVVEGLVVDMPMGQIKYAKLVLLAITTIRSSIQNSMSWESSESWDLDVALDADGDPKENYSDHEMNSMTFLLLGRTFGMLVGLVLQPAEDGMFIRVGKFSLIQQQSARLREIPRDNILQGLERHLVTII